MCPACIAGAAWLIAGTASAGGLTAFALRRTRGKGRSKKRRTTLAAHRSATAARLRQEVP